MQDTFARATHSAGQARHATIGYLVYNYKLLSKTFDFRHRNLIQFCQTDQLAAHCRSIHELFVIK